MNSGGVASAALFFFVAEMFHVEHSVSARRVTNVPRGTLIESLIFEDVPRETFGGIVGFQICSTWNILLQ